jgi:hypothetical protein
MAARRTGKGRRRRRGGAEEKEASQSATRSVDESGWKWRGKAVCELGFSGPGLGWAAYILWVVDLCCYITFTDKFVSNSNVFLTFLETKPWIYLGQKV